MEMNKFKLFARHLAEVSGDIIRGYFRTPINVDEKDDASPVTVADKNAEELMRHEIMRQYPEHGILGEEFGLHNPDSPYQWVLDPIDGTKSFICGAVTFGTLIALLKDGQPILGVINQPILNEFLIGDGKSAELNGKKVKVRQTKALDDSVLLTTDHLNIRKYQNIDKFDDLVSKVKLYRNWGDCYGYYLVATGFADIMIDPIMSKWDKMALIPIIKGAGGIITDYYGGDPVEGESTIAAVPAVHPKVIEMLK